ncbi:hypothetical protein [Peribacillus sp. SCS-155]
MAKSIMKRLLIAALPIVINQAKEYMKKKKAVKNMQKTNMAR